jgi:hypothetical protein
MRFLDGAAEALELVEPSQSHRRRSLPCAWGKDFVMQCPDRVLLGSIGKTRQRMRLPEGRRGGAKLLGCDDWKETFVKDFVAAWAKVMNIDRFDLA